MKGMIAAAVVESLAHDGRGIAHREGKVVFIDGALPGEKVSYKVLTSKKKHDDAVLVEVLEPSPHRVTAKCEHYGICGGCCLQHLDASAQIQFKQDRLIGVLKSIGKTAPEHILSPLVAEPWGYRRKARIGLRYSRKKEKMQIGFRERQARFLADLKRCEILHPAIGYKLETVAEAIAQLSIYDQIPQVEVAIGEDARAMIIRHLAALTENDLNVLRALGEKIDFQIYLQPKGPDTVHILWPENPQPLTYSLPAYSISSHYLPTDFTQINTAINRQMVTRALEFLDPQANESVLDLFCGLGNFTLPLAKSAQSVIGVEGEKGLVTRARENAARNNISNAEFHVANLFEDFSQFAWAKKGFDKILLDPPRSGALLVVQQLKKFKPKRIVYVSCDPATLARDTQEIVQNQGYRLTHAGVMDMFPHTAHVESLAVFDRV